jgi:hypothetical protein
MHRGAAFAAPCCVKRESHVELSYLKEVDYMATKLVNSEKVTLQDGTTVEIRPLNIKNLRKFMEVTKKFEKVKDENEGLTLLIEASQIALVAVDEEKFSDLEYLEEVLDMDTIGQIMKVSGGVDINADPNLVDAMA